MWISSQNFEVQILKCLLYVSACYTRIVMVVSRAEKSAIFLLNIKTMEFE